MDDLHRLAFHVARVVGVVERLQHLADDEGRQLGGMPRPLLRGDSQEPERIEAIDVLERDVVLAVHLAELENLHDLRVGELGGQLRLVDEHRDEARVGREVRQDPLDDDDLLKPCDEEIFARKTSAMPPTASRSSSV